ncbi:multiple inositol polyphosphate phosphatase 1-like [Thrips palmi]|uniref:Multiple inositol polyphosphate phosphatase 1 n=1 Tax=Thrips palmi TaxID=161013 RepID=A0A6P8YRS3_THRPL|nr:multiple inositol polyphosphate phosphatase 1-like [Thrips palmi]
MLPLLLLLGAGALVAGQDDQYCLARDQYPYLYFGPKTAYERVYDHKDSPQNVPYCRPLTLWFMGRPGTRAPDQETIRKMQSLTGLKARILRNHEGHGGRLCPEDLAALSRWHLNVTEDKALWLTGQGQADLSFLARRLKRRLPELLNNTYPANRFKFRHTSSQRTQESAEAFASGLFDRNRNEVEISPPMHNDPVLQFDEMCPSWTANGARAMAEAELFEKGPEMEQTITRVSRRLGFNYNLSMDNIDLMWEMCRYDKAWKYVSLSPWCAAFTEDDLKVMEYRADLQYYYRYSYGDQLNVDLGCPPVKDMLDHFSRMEMATDEAYENIPPPVGVFYFTHDAVLHMMLAALGVERDAIPLMANNMDQQTKRLFRTSYIGSFAANLAAVFYHCDQGEKHRVMFYLRERIVDMEGCQVGLCSWSHLRTRLRKAQVCSLKFCNANAATAVAPSRTALLAALGVAVVAALASL